MEAVLKKEFLLDGLCCGSCAAKIARDVGELEGVSAAVIDRLTGTLAVVMGMGQLESLKPRLSPWSRGMSQQCCYREGKTKSREKRCFLGRPGWRLREEDKDQAGRISGLSRRN
jgi:Cd2+/Zn2+-exporting ATPase